LCWQFNATIGTIGQQIPSVHRREWRILGPQGKKHPINPSHSCSVSAIVELNRSHHIPCHLSSVDVIFEFSCIDATYTVWILGNGKSPWGKFWFELSTSLRQIIVRSNWNTFQCYYLILHSFPAIRSLHPNQTRLFGCRRTNPVGWVQPRKGTKNRRTEHSLYLWFVIPPRCCARRKSCFGGYHGAIRAKLWGPWISSESSSIRPYS
jgi:hypothetical protein